jgi:uncharacterized repeat protein (TIGR03803 family)
MKPFRLSKIGCGILLLCAWAAAPAQTFTTLVNFNGTNGEHPGGEQITQGKDGNLYGAVTNGGTNGHGLLYKMTLTGNLTPLYDFCPTAGCADGSGPGGLILAASGDFYGATDSGGAFGYGTIFKFTGKGTPITLQSFNNTDGAGFTHLLQASNGTFYGATSAGGNSTECFSAGCGTVFELSSSGKTLTSLYSFCSLANCADGAVLYDVLALGPNGDYYGATWGGGGPADGGTIFSITPKGKLTTLYSFCDDYPFCSDGSNPIAIVLGTDKNFYGTTAAGGGNYDEGSIFKITPAGVLTTIYSFCSQLGCTDGSTPRNGLTRGSDGNFYGTTYYGGTYNLGTIFKVTPAGTLTTLHSFDGTDGDYPIGLLFQANNGIFYGTTNSGGTNNDGTLFSLNVGLRPRVKTSPQ